MKSSFESNMNLISIGDVSLPHKKDKTYSPHAILEYLVASINSKKFGNISIEIQKDIMDNDAIEKFIYYIVCELVCGKITEKIFVEIMKGFVKTKIDFNKVQYQSKINILLTDYNFHKALKIMKLLKQSKTEEVEIINFINTLKDTELVDTDSHPIKKINLFSENSNHNNQINHYNTLISITFFLYLTEMHTYIKAFVKCNINYKQLIQLKKNLEVNLEDKLKVNLENKLEDKLKVNLEEKLEDKLEVKLEDKLQNDVTNVVISEIHESKLIDDILDNEIKHVKDVKHIYDEKTINEHYELNLRNDLVDRLILLRKRFGLTFIKSIDDVEIITIKQYNDKSLYDAIKYYCNVVTKIKKHIERILIIYDTYIRRLKIIDEL
jgi:hypothetical protein